MMSKATPILILLHNSHLLQGNLLGLLYFWQFNDLAKILALDVLPVPLGPQNR